MQKLDVRIKGLYTNPNDFSEVPPGALLEASNIVIDKDSIADARRGQTFYSSGAFSDPLKSLFNYGDRLLAVAGTTLYYDNEAGTFTAYSGTFDDPDTGYKIRSAESNNNFYFTSDLGIYKLDSVTSTPVAAGAPRGLDVNGSTTGGSGFLANGYSAAYRVLWGYRDSNNNLIIGSPSQRFVIANSSGGTRDISLTTTIPSTITTSWFYQVYRSEQTTGEPDDELYLVLEGNPSSTDITNKTITFTDSTPDSLLGATLYTSPSQEGIAQANEPPPFAKDICTFNGLTLYANIKTKQRLYLTMISAAAIAINDTITIAGTTYTAKATETIASGQFELFTGGTVAENIEDTCLSLVRVINRYSSNTSVYAYYLSGYNDLPGKILIEERAINGSAFRATSAGAGDAFSPTLPTLASITGISVANPTVVTSASHGLTTGNQITIYGSNSTPSIDGTYSVTVLTGNTFSIPVNVTVSGSAGTWVRAEDEVESTNSEAQNGIAIAKNNQPEAVPLGSLIYTGSANQPIRRILALRDAVFVLKDDGVFRLTGTSFSDVQQAPFDNSVSLTANDSAVVFNNQIMCFTEQGVAAISDGGVQVISQKQIESTLLTISQFDNFADNTFGVAYESDRKYILWTVSSEDDTYPTIAYVWNDATKTWTTWDLARNCAIVNKGTNKLYLGNPVNDYCYVERKTYSFLDYADESYSISITAKSGYTITVADATNIAVGYAIKQGNRIAMVEDVSGTDITLNYSLNWTIAAAESYAPFTTRLSFVPLDAENPGLLKQFSECTYLFKNARFDEALVGFSSNFSTTEEQHAVEPTGGGVSGNFGEFAFGTISFGGLYVNQGRIGIRTYTPLEKQRALWVIASIELTQPFSNLSFMGMSYIYNVMSSKFK